jgi:hypothetical protein
MALSRACDHVVETGRKEIDGWVQLWVHARPALAGRAAISNNHPVFHSESRDRAVRENREFLDVAPQAGFEPATLRLTA